MLSLLQNDLPLDALKRKWAPAPSQFMPLMGMDVHYRDEGVRDDPFPIVLIHGTSASLHTWAGWVSFFKATRRVITVDIPGFGLTGPDPKADYTSTHYAEFVLALLDKLKVDRFVIGGNSLGGEVAWHVGVKAPERIKAMVLVDSAGIKAETGFPIGFTLAAIPQLTWLTTRSTPKVLVAASVHFVYGDKARIQPGVIDRYYDLLLRPGNRLALGQRLQEHRKGCDTSLLSRLTMPVMILWGAKDRLFGLDHAKDWHEALPGSRLVVLDECGHIPHEEDPALSAAAVQQFLHDVR
ncbi:MAG: alpha/beta hydrolase [Aquabacterium sp.]|nr:alpha/beta hydrolase [Aquabacterium sp.]